MEKLSYKHWLLQPLIKPHTLLKFTEASNSHQSSIRMFECA